MAKPIKIKAKVKNGVASVKALMPHDMETGSRKDADSGEVIPAHYIKEVVCEHNGNVVMTAYWGTGVSKNPYLSFKVKNAAAGDKIKISWVDNKGETSEGEVVAK
ncbi:MAG: thiosulfate oxidation carrier complex protein SoxZ [Gammaproteobacteria bacterium]|nr:thiosulfate oxidation carrier complex protein SoxZ [Gammaproteobacteria bacterium]